ncbi:WD40-repeat-containing domain protein [Naematelia encephala]|uniref:WD40-repeat-containing domain protein n=1 Tax=Naematelia encephala TaxID=71784 RepID=A0A1Y2AVN9_9TREE|nr:WD40-repeat-containing domain protein [Naematelia encephala]
MPRHVLQPLPRSLAGHRDMASRRHALTGDEWATVDRVQVLGGPSGGHRGCVNALSWSDDGSTLLSGSDDKRICIWGADSSPSPSSSSSPHPMKIVETIATGHRANIFSARFLPNTSTPTIVSCAGDRDVRVFEVERLSRVEMGMGMGVREELSGFNGPGVRVLRCHSDRTKRIATENSPHLFLTVSEDGTVRQHDLRRPHQCRSECPEALFYAPTGIDLYSLSVSTVTPYLFAVAGRTDCAYVCDRRMPERQTPRWSGTSRPSGQVHCVRRLGLPQSEWDSVKPRGRSIYSEENHITCVKMSPDNADEVICAFARHSTSLFSLYDSPPPSSIRTTSPILPPNSNTVRPPSNQVSPQPSPPPPDLRAQVESLDHATQARKRKATAVLPEEERNASPAARARLELEAESELPSQGANDRDKSDDATGAVENGEGMMNDIEDDQTGPTMENVMEDLRAEMDAPQARLGFALRAGPHGGAQAAEVDGESRNGESSSHSPSTHGAEDFLVDGEDDEDGLEDDLEEEDEYDEDDDEFDIFDDNDDDDDFDVDKLRSENGDFAAVDMIYPKRSFRGARNVETVKDCNFLGARSDKVCSGSDDGNFFVWDKDTGRLEGIWEGDGHVVNVMEQHPTLPLVAVSGIDNTVKMFAPTLTRPDPSFSRLHLRDEIIRSNIQPTGFQPASELGQVSLLDFLAARGFRVRLDEGIGGGVLQVGGDEIDSDDEEGMQQCTSQ